MARFPVDININKDNCASGALLYRTAHSLICLFQTKRKISFNETEVGEKKTSQHGQQVPSFEVGTNFRDDMRERYV